jgi:hypothetical protein
MYLINNLEKVKIEAMIIISGGTKLTPLRELYKDTGLSKLKDKRETNKLIQLFKMQNDLTLASLSTLIPNRFQDVHTYNTRNSNAFPLPRTRTSLYASYFLPSTLKLWNSLQIKDCPSLSILKSIITSRVDHDNVPKYYYYGPRLTQILHARLRMRSSSLNVHLYLKTIIDSPNCFCGDIESTHLYLFKCPKYTRQRNSLFRTLLQLLNIRPLENLLLFGSSDLDIDSNTIIFTTVHIYISQSKRFL